MYLNEPSALQRLLRLYAHNDIAFHFQFLHVWGIVWDVIIRFMNLGGLSSINKILKKSFLNSVS